MHLKGQIWALVLSLFIMGQLTTLLAAQPALHAPGMSLTEFDQDAALEYSQAAIGRSVGDYRFTRADYRTVQMSDFKGTPTIISLIYTSCYQTCPVLTHYLARAVEQGREIFGDDAFSVLTIGFDTRNDTPSRMSYFEGQQQVDDVRWVFASTDAETIDSLARDLGFIFVSAPHGFDHLAQTTIIDSDGVVFTQVYGQNLSLPAIMEPLKQLIFGRAATAATFGGWISGVKLFCTIYDPKGDRYLFDYSLFVRMAIAALSFGGILAFVIVNWRRSKRPAR